MVFQFTLAIGLIVSTIVMYDRLPAVGPATVNERNVVAAFTNIRPRLSFAFLASRRVGNIVTECHENTEVESRTEMDVRHPKPSASTAEPLRVWYLFQIPFHKRMRGLMSAAARVTVCQSSFFAEDVSLKPAQIYCFWFAGDRFRLHLPHAFWGDEKTWPHK